MRFFSKRSYAGDGHSQTWPRLAALGLGALILAISLPAKAEPSTCSQVANPAGRGMQITRICTANALGFNNTYDAYYRVSVSIAAGPGFANEARFRERSTEGRILAGLLNLFTNSERVTSVDLGISIRQGDYQYPVRPLLQFRRTNDDHWTSFIRGDARSFFHRLGNSRPFYVTLSYSYSRTSTIDLTVGSSFLQSAGINIVTPAVAPIFSAVNRITSSIVSAGNITSESGTEQLLSPARGDNVELEFLVAGQGSTAPIATIRVRLEGARSMMAEPRQHAEIHTTLPSDRIADQTVASLSQQIATGQAQSWDVSSIALATAPLASLPLGREATAADLRSLCSTIEGKLQTDYGLTTFDNLMVRARLVNRAAEPVRERINPFQQCFEPADRSLIRTHLGYDTEYPVILPPPPLAPFDDVDALYRFGCLFTGQLGPNCSAADATPERINRSLDEAIEVASLEGIADEQVYASLPSNRTISPANFQQRFGGQFVRFRSISGVSGSMQLQETEGGPWLTLVAERAPNGKLRRITIRR